MVTTTFFRVVDGVVIEPAAVITMNYQVGATGKSQYQSYLATTTDNPPLSEAAWSSGGIINPYTVTITNALANKVDKVTGKGLSTNDLTQTLIDTWNAKQDTITPTADTTPVDTDYVITQRGGSWLKTLVSDWIIKLETYFGRLSTVNTWALLQTFTSGVKTGKIQPITDSTTAIQIMKADGVTPVVTVDSVNGYIGIGTTNPSNQLEIYSNTNSNLLKLTQTGAVNQANINFSTVGGTGLFQLDQGGSMVFRTLQGGLYFDNFGTGSTYFRTGGVNVRMTIDNTGNVNFNSGQMYVQQSNGNVGIGTTAPKSKCDVNGGVRVADDTDAASVNKAGTTRYRVSGTTSYYEICIQTGATTFIWDVIKTYTW